VLSREEAFALVTEHLKNKNLIKHVLAVESIMRVLADNFGGDKELWGLAGLLHDIDYEETKDSPGKHGYRTLEIIENLDVPDEVRGAILAHAGHTMRDSKMDKAIYCSDPVTGLIVASTLMHPTKRLDGVDAEFVGKRFKEKRFAAGANREAIASCSELGVELHEFFELSLDAMRSISAELGL
jgi:putative nucleotidyltransferase with HDIG domain